MDVLYFLKKRTAFIRRFYNLSCVPFDQIKAQIEVGEPPFAPPEFYLDRYESDEPPFLEEWLEADMARRVVGLAAVSMLSDTLKIYFQALERQFGFSVTEHGKRTAFKQGFLGGYRSVLATILDTDWSDCPADFDILEQVTLARNRAQHGESIFDFDVSHDQRMLERHGDPFFVGDDYKMASAPPNEAMHSWLSPNIDVTEKALLKAVEQVEALAEWVSAREHVGRQWRATRP